MKLRFDGNSIRLRLAQGDLDVLLEAGTIAEGLRFADGRRLVYALSSAGDPAGGPTVGFDGESVTVMITSGNVSSLRDGLSVEFAAGGHGGSDLLHVLVEMDLPCKHGDGT